MARAKRAVISAQSLRHLKMVARRGAVCVARSSQTFQREVPDLCRLRLIYWDEDLMYVLLTPRGTKYLAAL